MFTFTFKLRVQPGLFATINGDRTVSIICVICCLFSNFFVVHKDEIKSTLLH